MMGDKENKKTVEFSGLILGFCSAALSYMGYGESGLTRNLELARQNIEIIKLLKEKTRGNLSQDEDHLIAEVLRDLDNKFQEVSRG